MLYLVATDICARFEVLFSQGLDLSSLHDFSSICIAPFPKAQAGAAPGTA